MSGASSRRLGKTTELMVARWLRDHGYPNARRQLAGQGQTSDIDGVPGVAIEVKARKSSAWPTWQRQAAAAASTNHHRVIVVRRTIGKPDVGAWEARWMNGFHGSPTWHAGTFAEALE